MSDQIDDQALFTNDPYQQRRLLDDERLVRRDDGIVYVKGKKPNRDSTWGSGGLIVVKEVPGGMRVARERVNREKNLVGTVPADSAPAAQVGDMEELLVGLPGTDGPLRVMRDPANHLLVHEDFRLEDSKRGRGKHALEGVDVRVTDGEGVERGVSLSITRGDDGKPTEVTLKVLDGEGGVIAEETVDHSAPDGLILRSNRVAEGWDHLAGTVVAATSNKERTRLLRDQLSQADFVLPSEIETAASNGAEYIEAQRKHDEKVGFGREMRGEGRRLF